MANYRQLFLDHLGQTSLTPLLLEIERAEGVFVYSPSGKKYLDLISGVCVNNVGHCHPEIVKAIKKQAETYSHLMVYGEIIQSPQVRYAEKLSTVLPDPLESCFFVNSGSEAVEGALKLAKRFTGRSRIISFKNAYHGSTHGALSVQGNEQFKNAFRPLLPDTFIVDFNNPISLDYIDDHTACVIVEPVMAEAGVIFPENNFLQLLREKCTESGALLIFDEVQTGFGRIGELFASVRFNVVPDIIVLAKALGGGMPLGAFISSKEIMSSLSRNPQLGHITTFGGHPVSCAAGLASLDIIINQNLVSECRRKSGLFRNHLKHPAIKTIHGEGLLLAVELKDNRYVSYAVSHAPDFSLILDYFLFCGDRFRIAPPLTITNDEIMWACNRLSDLLDDVIQNVK